MQFLSRHQIERHYVGNQEQRLLQLHPEWHNDDLSTGNRHRELQEQLESSDWGPLLKSINQLAPDEVGSELADDQAHDARVHRFQSPPC